MTAKFLLDCIGDIHDDFLEEAEWINVAIQNTRKRAIKYGALATVASVGIAVTMLWIRSKRSGMKAA
ncbi:MAG: hypothetical protein FWE05_12905 [Defluviitaleaceae bacterium]|nr:hypothetical protein [Defluviitaleaceae bacterium]